MQVSQKTTSKFTSYTTPLPNLPPEPTPMQSRLSVSSSHSGTNRTHLPSLTCPTLFPTLTGSESANQEIASSPSAHTSTEVPSSTGKIQSIVAVSTRSYRAIANGNCMTHSTLRLGLMPGTTCTLCRKYILHSQPLCSNYRLEINVPSSVLGKDGHPCPTQAQTKAPFKSFPTFSSARPTSYSDLSSAPSNLATLPAIPPHL